MPCTRLTERLALRVRNRENPGRVALHARAVAHGHVTGLLPMAFRIHALPAERFAALFGMGTEELRVHGACRVEAERGTGHLCRVSLIDAAPGETLILTHFEHHPVDSPYRASHAIFVREGAHEARPEPDEIPASLVPSLLSLRAFDAGHFLTDADVIEGADLDGAIRRMFDDGRVAYLHVHHARQGCYAARVNRA